MDRAAEVGVGETGGERPAYGSDDQPPTLDGLGDRVGLGESGDVEALGWRHGGRFGDRVGRRGGEPAVDEVEAPDRRGATQQGKHQQHGQPRAVASITRSHR